MSTSRAGEILPPAPGRRILAPHGVLVAWEETSRRQRAGAGVGAVAGEDTGAEAPAEATASSPDQAGESQRRRQVSRRLLRSLLGAQLSAQLSNEFDLVQQCPACGSDTHGPLRVQQHNLHGEARGPATRSPLVSVSYAGPIVVVAVAPPRSSAFGIDAELDTPETRRAAAEALGRATAHCEIRDWTRVEAAAKATGRGLRGDWASRDFDALTIFDLTLPRTSETQTPAVVSIALRRDVSRAC